MILMNRYVFVAFCARVSTDEATCDGHRLTRAASTSMRMVKSFPAGTHWRKRSMRMDMGRAVFQRQVRLFSHLRQHLDEEVCAFH